jgi:transposase-like protein
MSSRRKSSPWAFDDAELACPRCGGNRIARILDTWSRSRGVQMFKCTSCGKKFYDRGFDDYRPTFIR